MYSLLPARESLLLVIVIFFTTLKTLAEDESHGVTTLKNKKQRHGAEWCLLQCVIVLRGLCRTNPFHREVALQGKVSPTDEPTGVQSSA